MAEGIAQAWAPVRAAAEAEAAQSISGFFAADPGRAGAMRIEGPGIALDWSRARIGPRGRAALMAFVDGSGVERALRAMARGEPVNATEGRAADHMALRAPEPRPEVAEAAARAARFADELRGDGTRAVLWLGIGGSDLGPRFAVDALWPLADGPEVRFASNVDGAALDRALRGLDPAATRIVIASKSFSTTETMMNARSARAWMAAALGEAETARRTAAVTANPARAEAFGVDAEAVFPIWDWVGGRFSVWSAVGLPIRIACGNAAFAAFLAGAAAIDAHVLAARPAENLALVLAALDLWHMNALGLPALALVPYADRLALMPAYLQQLVMETNGKGVTLDGSPAPLLAAPILWGAAGTDAQHSFFQWLHQAPRPCPVEFVLPVGPSDRPEHRDALVAHCLAQASALMLGRDRAATEAAMAAEGADPAEIARLAPHRTFPGDRPSVMLTIEEVTPRALGALIALYEHRVAAAAAMAGINAFDQWGVEYGKTMAGRIAPLLAGEPGAAPDPATAAAIAAIRAVRDPSKA